MATIEYRSLSDFNRGLNLILNKEATYEQASQISSESPSKLKRAIKAINSGRPIGLNGHPFIFNEMEENSLIEQFQELKKDQEALYYGIIRQKVFNLFNFKK